LVVAGVLIGLTIAGLVVVGLKLVKRESKRSKRKETTTRLVRVESSESSRSKQPQPKGEVDRVVYRNLERRRIVRDVEGNIKEIIIERVVKT